MKVRGWIISCSHLGLSHVNRSKARARMTLDIGNLYICYHWSRDHFTDVTPMMSQVLSYKSIQKCTN